MINIEKFKRHIIQLGLEGKLTNRLADNKKVDTLTQFLFKKNKKYASFSKELTTFEIPKEWKWCMTYEAVSFENGNENAGLELPYLDVKYLRTGTNPTFVKKGCIVNQGDKVILVDGENSGEVFSIKEKGYRGSTLKILNISRAFISEYVLLFICLYKEKFRGNKTGSAIPHLNKNIFFELPIPLPSLEEQKNIVERINEIFKEIEIIGDNFNALISLKEKLLNKVIKIALSGELVEHLSTEGNVNDYFNNINLQDKKRSKKKSNLLNVQGDEIPYEIPQNWRWCKIGDVCNIVNGFTPSRTNKDFWENGTINWMTVDDINKQGKYLVETAQHITEKAVKSSDRIVPPDSTFLCCTSATIGRVAINKVPMASNQQFNGIIIKNEFKHLLTNEYVYLVCSTYKNQLIDIAGITTFPFVSVSKLANMYIPVPPLKEQERILKKIQEVTSLCEDY